MEINPVATPSAIGAIAKHLQANTEMQMAIMKQLAESQQQMAEMLQDLGVGMNIDTRV